MTWSGVLNPAATAKTPEQITREDYLQCEVTHFPAWFVLWGYFEEQPYFAPLMPELRRQYDERVAAQSE